MKKEDTKNNLEFKGSEDDFPSLSTEKVKSNNSVWGNKEKLNKVCTGEFKNKRKIIKLHLKKDIEYENTENWSSIDEYNSEEDYDYDYEENINYFLNIVLVIFCFLMKELIFLF